VAAKASYFEVFDAQLQLYPENALARTELKLAYGHRAALQGAGRGLEPEGPGLGRPSL